MHQPQPLTPALCQPHRPSFAYPSPHHMPTPAPEPTMDSSPRACHGFQPPSLPWIHQTRTPTGPHAWPPARSVRRRRSRRGLPRLSSHEPRRPQVRSHRISVFHGLARPFHGFRSLSHHPVTGHVAISVVGLLTLYGVGAFALRTTLRWRNAKQLYQQQLISYQVGFHGFPPASMAFPQLPWPSSSFHDLLEASLDLFHVPRHPSLIRASPIAPPTARRRTPTASDPPTGLSYASPSSLSKSKQSKHSYSYMLYCAPSSHRLRLPPRAGR